MPQACVHQQHLAHYFILSIKVRPQEDNYHARMGTTFYSTPRQFPDSTLLWPFPDCKATMALQGGNWQCSSYNCASFLWSGTHQTHCQEMLSVFGNIQESPYIIWVGTTHDLIVRRIPTTEVTSSKCALGLSIWTLLCPVITIMCVIVVNLHIASPPCMTSRPFL